MNSKEKKELAISEIVLIALGVAGLLVVLWLAWFRPTNKKAIDSYEACAAAGNPIEESYPSVCMTKDGKRFVNPKEKTAPPVAPATEQPSQNPAEQKYLTINEWNVRVPLTMETSDLKYTYVKTADSEYVTFTFQRLEDMSICKNDVGVALSRATTQNQPPFTIDNPEPAAYVGGYYYYLAYGGSPCYDADNADHMKVVNAISPNASLTLTVKQLLQKLQLST